MPYHPDIHRRQTIRLRDYDYATGGAYFVTICTHEREHLFGRVTEGTMRLSKTGEMVQDEWLRTSAVRPEVELDAYVVMPNHIHGIIVIHDFVGATRWVARRSPHDLTPRATHRVAPTPGPPAGSLGAIIGQFKSAVTRRVMAMQGAVPLWQRNYYERIIRDEAELASIRDYIAANSACWDEDEYR